MPYTEYTIYIMSKTHLQHLDVLKGVTIFFVVVGHAFHFGYEYYRSPLLTMLVSMDMPIFLFISGLLGASTLKFGTTEIVAYWRKKSRQLLLPLITLPTLYAIIHRIPSSEIWLGRMHGGYWFTLVLFEMFVLLYIVRWINEYVNRQRHPLIELALLGSSLIGVLIIDPVWHDLAPQSYEAMSWAKTSQLYLYFIIGYLAGRYELFRAWLCSPLVHATTGIAFVLLVRHDYILGTPMLGGVATSLTGMIFAYATACAIGDRESYANRLWAYLGRESRTVYLTHFFILFSAPGVGEWLRSQPTTSRTIMWEAIASSSYALIVIALTLIIVRIIRSSAILDLLCYGKRLPSTIKL